MSGRRDLDSELFRFDRNTVVQASAGTGKTETLTTLYVCCLAGATELPLADGEDGRIAPERMLAITFTEKAAGEMRDRIRRAIFALAGGGGEPVLERRFAAQVQRIQKKRPAYRPPDVGAWLDIERRLAGATITTFHSFAGSLVRRHPLELGVDPGYGVLDETEAGRMLEECARAAIREGLADGDAGLRELVSAWGYAGAAQQTQTALRWLADRAWAPSRLLEGSHLCDPEWLTAETRARGELLVPVLRDVAVCADGGFADEVNLALSDVAATLESLEAALAAPRFTLEDLTAAHTALSEALVRIGGKRRNNLGPAKKAATAALDESDPTPLRLLPRGRQLAEALAQLVEATGERYERQKAAREALDFADLIVKARQLLREEPLRRAIRDRYDVVMVDEFQDTDAVQAEVIECLRTEDDGSSLKGSGLFIVGDRKQSIYGFRGADVQVFMDFAERIERRGGTTLALRTSYRALSGVLDGVNDLSERTLGAESEYGTGYSPEDDDLVAHREGGDGPRIELLDGSGHEAPRAAIREARMAARRIAELVHRREPLIMDADGPRPAAFGDVAILLPRFTYLQRWLDELEACDVPYSVVRGRGFFGTQEVRDVVRALGLLLDRDDPVALAAVLRSPFVGLSDDSLVALCEEAGGRLDGRWLRPGPPLPTVFTPEEAERLAAFASLFQHLGWHGDRVGPSRVVRALLEETGFRAVLAASPSGAQKVANVERVAALALAEEAGGHADLKAFIRDLEGRVGSARADRAAGREPLAAIVEETGGDAVRVMTVHAAKGLQFPVVVAAELARRTRHHSANLLLDRDLGPCVKVPGERGENVAVGRYEEARVRLRDREKAERDRLFYVAITRARDYLLLTGETHAKTAPGERPLVDAAVAEPSNAGVFRVTRLEDLPSPAAAEEGMARVDRLDAKSARALAVRVAPIRPLAARRLFLPVTALQDFDLCPRRYRAVHLLGLDEHPGPRVPPEADPDEPEAGGRDARWRGSAVHRLLERADLARVRAEGVDHLRALALADGLEADAGGRDADLVEDARGFLESEYGRALEPDSVAREVPFLLVARRGGLGVHLKGQIDLLVARPDGVDVVDYKHTRRGKDGAEPYRFQLECYGAAAVTAGSGERGAATRLGIAFLAGRADEPSWLDDAAPPDEVVERIGVLGEALLEARSAGVWEGRPEDHCRAIGCGYVGLCHRPR